MSKKEDREKLKKLVDTYLSAGKAISRQTANYASGYPDNKGYNPKFDYKTGKYRKRIRRLKSLGYEVGMHLNEEKLKRMYKVLK